MLPKRGRLVIQVRAPFPERQQRKPTSVAGIGEHPRAFATDFVGFGVKLATATVN